MFVTSDHELQPYHLSRQQWECLRLLESRKPTDRLEVELDIRFGPMDWVEHQQ